MNYNDAAFSYGIVVNNLLEVPSESLSGQFIGRAFLGLYNVHVHVL